MKQGSDNRICYTDKYNTNQNFGRQKTSPLVGASGDSMGNAQPSDAVDNNPTS